MLFERSLEDLLKDHNDTYKHLSDHERGKTILNNEQYQMLQERLLILKDVIAQKTVKETK